jgi:Protein of unknown function (DUF1573)
MKIIIIIASAILFGYQANAQVLTFGGGDTHDFGTVPCGPDAVYEYEFTNTGTAPLLIQKCAGSCSCTKPTCPTQPIMPGQKGKIIVHFETKDKEGAFNKSVFIKCNATNVNPNVGQYEIFIKGNVLVKGAKATKTAKVMPALANKKAATIGTKKKR